MAPPVAEATLRQIVDDACHAVLENVNGYDHAATEQWTDTIINRILQSLVSLKQFEGSQSPYKWIVNSTIIQHATPVAGKAATNGASKDKVGRRGMRSATGAFWNTEKDGMWSHKYEGAEEQGMDVVICVMWVAI